MENPDCRSVYDKISNRLERRQRRRADDKNSAIFRVFCVCGTIGSRNHSRSICVYMCKSVWI